MTDETSDDASDEQLITNLTFQTPDHEVHMNATEDYHFGEVDGETIALTTRSLINMLMPMGELVVGTDDDEQTTYVIHDELSQQTDSSDEVIFVVDSDE